MHVNEARRRSARIAARERRNRLDPQPEALPRQRRRPRKQKKTTETSTRPGVRRVGIMDLPTELRLKIVRNLIHSKNGPEVYVGKASRAPVLSSPEGNGVGQPSYARFRFHSSVTNTMEYGETLFRNGRYFIQAPEQSWVWAYRTLRPLMACKTLYYEATTIFFEEKHFVLGSSTYAHAWLRRIGQRNQVNLRNIRLKIHIELTATGCINERGTLWIEVLKKLGRSARGLKVLGFEFDVDVIHWRSTLLQAFLRMKKLHNLEHIDFFHFHRFSRTKSKRLLAMMAASTGCPLVRCLQLPEPGNGRPWLVRRALRDDQGHIRVLEEK